MMASALGLEDKIVVVTGGSQGVGQGFLVVTTSPAVVALAQMPLVGNLALLEQLVELLVGAVEVEKSVRVLLHI